MLRYHQRAEERLQEMAGALPAKKGRPEREAGERLAAHALTSKPPQSDRVASGRLEMNPAENAEFEEAAGYLPEDLGYETVTPKEGWIPPEEWAGSKSPGERAPTARTRIRPSSAASVEAATDPMRLSLAERQEGRQHPRARRLRGRDEPVRHDPAADDA